MRGATELLYCLNAGYQRAIHRLSTYWWFGAVIMWVFGAVMMWLFGAPAPNRMVVAAVAKWAVGAPAVIMWVFGAPAPNTALVRNSVGQHSAVAETRRWPGHRVGHERRAGD